MKRGILILALLTPGVALAQTLPGAKAAPKPSTQEAAAAFAISPPDEGSPFFSEREAAKDYISDQAQSNNGTANTVATYPRTKNSPDSATAMFSRFFTDMFSSVKIGSLHTDTTTENLKITPSDFSIKDRHEVDSSYTVRNNTGKLMRLEFNTSQRVELVTEDSNGKVINKWSDDQAYQPQDGLVVINPKERIEYNQSLPTRDMKPQETYTIKADVVGYPDYTVTHSVTPAP